MMGGMNPYSLLGNMQGMGGMNPFAGLPGGLGQGGLSNMTPSMLSNLYMQGAVNRGQFQNQRMMEQVDFFLNCFAVIFPEMKRSVA